MEETKCAGLSSSPRTIGEQPCQRAVSLRRERPLTIPGSRSFRLGYQLWGSAMDLRYPVVKLVDYAESQAALEASDNPFALAVLAHLKTLETRGDAEARLTWKLRLGRMLFARSWQRKEIEELMQFLDWIMSLPEALEDRFDTQWQELEREQTMAQTMPPIIRRAQARGEAIGEQRGKRDTLLRLMESRSPACRCPCADRAGLGYRSTGPAVRCCFDRRDA
jgi:hypothetical protein